MRLVNADDIVFFGNKDSNSNLITFKSNIDSLPTVEAIPIEKVARMLACCSKNLPCSYNWGELKALRDDFCNKGKDGCSYDFFNDHEASDCWLHALKEGWLDE